MAQLALLETEPVLPRARRNGQAAERRRSVFTGGHSGLVLEAIFPLHFPGAHAVLDMTYGKGTFWKWPHALEVTAIDIEPQQPGVEQMDARCTRFEVGSFEVVVIDPPFMHGVKARTSDRQTYTGTLPAMNRDYAHLPSQRAVIELYRGMILEARRLVRVAPNTGAIVKCKDTVEHGDFIEISRHVSEALDFYDFRVIDKAVIIPSNALPTNEHHTVAHFRRQESYFYVARPKRRRG